MESTGFWFRLLDKWSFMELPEELDAHIKHEIKMYSDIYQWYLSKEDANDLLNVFKSCVARIFDIDVS
jgi:hypothetical protein